MQAKFLILVKMKNKFLLIISMLMLSVLSFAQQEEEGSHKFRKENIFVGGGFGLGLGNGGFSVGVNPEIGYTITKWLDAGISTNFNYFSYSASYNGGISQNSFNYGGGVFVRLYPINGFFLQVLPEYNRVTTHFKDLNPGSVGIQYNYRREAPSLLLGVGYGSRTVGNTNFFTILMIDAGSNTNSPYIDSYGSKLPILRAGFDFYLRPKRKQ